MSNDLYNWNLQEGAPFGEDSPLEALADEVGSWLISENIHFKPAPAQSREEEALCNARTAANTLHDYIHPPAEYRISAPATYDNAVEALTKLDASLAALRSRQSPQAEPSPDYPPGHCIKCGAPVPDHYAKCPAAAPQPSPQGEDAFDDDLWIIEQYIKRASYQMSTFMRNGRMIDNEMVKKALDALRARLASAQSSAQGEEAREMRSFDQFWDAVIEASKKIHVSGNTTLFDHPGVMNRFYAEARAALERNTKERN